MTLHETVETFKKLGIGSAIGIALIIVLVVTINVGKVIKSILFPVKAEIANHTYGEVPAIEFPENVTTANFVYKINTLSGKFEVFPDRLNLYKLNIPQPNFLNLEQAREKAKSLGFITDTGVVVPEIPLGDATYEWDEPRGLQRKLIFNIVSFDFNITSNYLTSLTVLNAIGLQNIGEQGAIDTTTDFLDKILLLTDDIDLAKTQSTENKVNYYTYPQILGIRNSTLVPATSLSNAQVIRVDLYQKDVEYELNTGLRGENSIMQRNKIKLPILYPNPPYSTMSFWVGMGPQGPTVLEGKYYHRNYIVDDKEEPTYSIKSAEEAFTELQNGEGYIAAFNGPPEDAEILIDNAYLAYYIGEEPQEYLMPIFVFEGSNGFFGYVSAIRNDWVE